MEAMREDGGSTGDDGWRRWWSGGSYWSDGVCSGRRWQMGEWVVMCCTVLNCWVKQTCSKERSRCCLTFFKTHHFFFFFVISNIYCTVLPSLRHNLNFNTMNNFNIKLQVA
jgi:hypothetical protein